MSTSGLRSTLIAVTTASLAALGALVVAAPSDGATSSSTATTAPSTTSTAAPVTTRATTTGSSTTSSPTSVCPTFPPLKTYAPNELVVAYDFESTTVPIAVRGDAGTTSVTVAGTGVNGSTSLFLSNATADAGLSVSVWPGGFGTFEATALVRTGPGQPQTRMVLRPLYGDGQAGAVNATSSGWSSVSARFAPPTAIYDYFCNGVFTGTRRPGGMTLALRPDPSCSPGSPLATSFYVDSVEVRALSSSSTSISSASPPCVVTTTTTPTTSTPTTSTSEPYTTGPLCSARLNVISRWPGGYQAELTILNGSAHAFPSWSVTAAVPGQTVVSLWPATWSQSEGVVRMQKASWQPAVPAGGTVSVGLVASGGVSSAVSSVVLNSDRCTVT